jgi:hypothetical protein
MSIEQEVIPKNTRELYFYMKGEFDTINSKFKLVFWIGGISGSIFSAIVLGLFKLLWG